jgi:DNA-binding beta-propeller fold protein YncE
MELSPDGARAYLVLRETSQLAVIDVPADLVDPSGVELVDLPGTTLGSLTLTRDGSRGVMYTNATLDERLTIVELDQAGYPSETYPIEKSVRAVGISPDGDKLIVLHARAPGDPGDATTFDEFIDRSFGYSVIDVATGFAKLQITSVDPGNFAFAGSQDRAYVVLDGGDAEGALAAVQEVELDTGVVRTIALGSPPDTVGVLPDTDKVFVSQRHPLGRVTFIDVATGQVRTLTGFDLNSQIID